MPVNDFHWQYGTLASALISGSSMVLGRYFRSIGHLLGNRNLSTFEVTEYEPSNKYGFKSLSGPLHSHTSYIFEAEGQGTRIAVSTKIRAVNLARVRVDILEHQLKRQLKENLVILKSSLEAGPVIWSPFW
jgi:hypothetical protein